MTRNAKGQFEPGESGNPGGRPKGVKEVRDRLNEAMAEVLEELVKTALGPDSTAKSKAIDMILTRCLGKPQSAAEVQMTEARAEEKVLVLRKVSKRSELPKNVQEQLAAGDDAGE